MDLIRILSHIPLHRHHSKIISPNELIVLCAVDTYKDTNPTSIAKILGAHPKTYMRICRDLADDGLLVVKHPQRIRPGRPAFIYALSKAGADMCAIILQRAIKDSQSPNLKAS